MIKPIMTNEISLARPSETATAADAQTAQDLLDTLAAHAHECVGMAANMIGASKRIIVFDNEGEYMVMLNPVIVKKSGAYEATEGSRLSDAAPPRATAPSRFATRTPIFTRERKRTRAGPRRSSSTRSTTQTGSSSKGPP